ncbi:MAG: NYN domain-containing protein [Treponema sp.]|nr:NYN domain-containing protein [Treponema sp.]
MATRKKSVIRIGIYYDGNYFYKTSNFYKFDHPRQSRISIPGLHNYICNEVASRLGTDINACKVVEAHYFRGRMVKTGNERAIIGERYFEDALTREGVDLHYLPLVRGSNNELKEKGIDVSLALDAYKKAAAKAIDILVLIAGDGDYLPLVRELQTMGNPIDVMLLSWDFECANGDLTITSQDLLEEVKYPIQMAIVIDDRLNLKNPVISGLFEPRQVEAPAPPPVQTYISSPAASALVDPPLLSNYADPVSNTFQASPYQASPFPAQNGKRRALSEDEMAQERISTILSLDNTGGWIRDIEYNNFYFFNADVINKKPDELSIGMALQFRLKFDKIKTEQKDNGEPSYRAIGPILAVD